MPENVYSAMFLSNGASKQGGTRCLQIDDQTVRDQAVDAVLAAEKPCKPPITLAHVAAGSCVACFDRSSDAHPSRGGLFRAS